MRPSAFVALLALTACHTPDARPIADPETVPTGQLTGTDHHVHLLGPDLIGDWKALGIPFSRSDSVYLRADRYLSQVDRVVLVPMAHAYGNREMLAALDLSGDSVRVRVSRENDHVLTEAARLAPRALAFCSAPALEAFAHAELERCIAAGGRGIKLHLAASGVDLRESADVEVVKSILGWAASAELPVLLHLDTQRRGTEIEHVDRFLRMAIEPYHDLVVIIAHLGGSGGYGDWTQEVFRTVSTWLAERFAADDPRAGVYFDLSAVVLQEESEGVPATTEAEAAALTRDLRVSGLSRIVFGSDAPVFGPATYAALLIDRGVLSREEMAKVLRNSPLRN